jgi:hypothetical protein
MLYAKWNWDDAKEVWQEEAEARGITAISKKKKNPPPKAWGFP